MENWSFKVNFDYFKKNSILNLKIRKTLCKFSSYISSKFDHLGFESRHVVTMKTNKLTTYAAGELDSNHPCQTDRYWPTDDKIKRWRIGVDWSLNFLHRLKSTLITVRFLNTKKATRCVTLVGLAHTAIIVIVEWRIVHFSSLFLWFTNGSVLSVTKAIKRDSLRTSSSPSYRNSIPVRSNITVKSLNLSL